MSEPAGRDAATRTPEATAPPVGPAAAAEPVDAADGTGSGSGDGAGSAEATGPRVLTGRYLLEERVASGGMASVWRAHDEVLARTVAVKLLHDHLAADADFRERFRREAVAAAKLTHPSVVSLYDTGRDGDNVYLVMEFIDGSTLKDVIRDAAPLDIAQAAAIGEQVGRALDYAHSRGLVHRDVKPANILIGTDGAVKVADFGIAKADQADDLTRTGMVLGTAAYVAPEQIRGEPVDGKADQYSLAIVVYEALTGQQPFRAETPVATAAQRLERDPLPVRSLRAAAPRALDAVLMRALARDPRDRFPTTGAFADALGEFAGGDTGETAALVAPPPQRHPQRDHLEGRAASPAGDSFLHSEGRFLAPVLALLLLAGALIGVGLWTGVLEANPDGPFPRIAGQEGVPDAATSASDIPLAGVPTTFDPFGSGVEQDDMLPNLGDGDPETFWRTERYNSRAFGNLKPGVGFVLDLGAPHRLDNVVLRTVTPGVTVELRVADAPETALEGWSTVARVADAQSELIDLRPGSEVVTRHVLVWLTGDLPTGQGELFGGRFAGGFSQVAAFGAPA
jgi:eukaryotic-like serine/threonine-protein kinase